MVNKSLLTGLADNAGQARQHSRFLFADNFGELGRALRLGDIVDEGGKKRWNGGNDGLLRRSSIEAKRRGDARDDVGGQELAISATSLVATGIS